MTGIKKLRAIYPWPANRPTQRRPPSDWFAEGSREALSRFINSKMSCIVELGSWHGVSTRWICDRAPNAVVIAVDTWLGDIEHLTTMPDAFAHLPNLYETFLFHSWEYRDQIIPLRNTSLIGMRLLARLGIKPDLIYIDASHDSDDVAADLRTALRLFPDAQIVGDDWDIASVSEGVRRVIPHSVTGNNGRAWWINRGVDK